MPLPDPLLVTRVEWLRFFILRDMACAMVAMSDDGLRWSTIVRGNRGNRTVNGSVSRPFPKYVSD